MNRLKKIKALKEQIELFQLENRGIIARYTMPELCSIYNGIGPDAFPEWLRGVITSLNPALEPAAFIHDVEWHESDGSKISFQASNARLERNGRRIAAGQYHRFDPRRYLLAHQAARFARLCTMFGWTAWCAPCSCAVCRKKN